MGPLASQNRRRSEKKPTWLPILLLIAVLCLGSFFGGQWFGRDRQQTPSIEVPPAPLRLAVEAPPEPAVNAAKSPTGTEDLTFFDTLPKGEQPPLGSGINIPPTPSAPRQEMNPPAPKAPMEVTPAKTAVQEAVPPSTAPAAVAAQAAAGSYLVQAASFPKWEDAQTLSVRLVKKNYPVFLQTAQLGERGTWYRVMIGPFENVSAAERVVMRLQDEEKLSPMVRKR